MNFKIRPMVYSDAVHIERIENEHFGRNAWNKTLIIGDMNLSYSNNRCICMNDELVGYVCVYEMFPTAEIANFAIKSTFQRRGLACTLMDYVICDLQAKNFEEIFLEVQFDNIAAIKLYQKAGFEYLKTRANYYGKGLDAYIMRRSLVEK